MINTKTTLITTKPIIYIINLSKKDFLRKKNKHLPKIKAWIDTHGGGLSVPYSVEFEQELSDAKLGGPEAVQAFIAESYSEYPKIPPIPSALARIIKQGFKQLGLIYYFTAGETEVRAWTVYGGALAPVAAGVIHTDFERGFIKAEVVSWEDYRALTTKPSEGEVKAAGKYRQEGKAYLMQDGDVVHFQFNVSGGKKK